MVLSKHIRHKKIFCPGKGKEIAFTEVPGVGLSIHEKPRTCRFTTTGSSACSIAAPFLGLENEALYRPNSPVA